MNERIKQAFDAEMQAAREHYRRRDFDGAFRHLERAHILGQRSAWRHTRSHLWMLRLGWVARDWQEVRGQLPRILAALLLSRLWVPLGNSGRSRVSAIRPMPVPQDLRPYLEK